MSPSVSTRPYLLNTVLQRVPGKHAPAERSRAFRGGPQPALTRCSPRQGAVHPGRCWGGGLRRGSQPAGDGRSFAGAFPTADASHRPKHKPLLLFTTAAGLESSRKVQLRHQSSSLLFSSRRNATFLPSAAPAAGFIAIRSYIFLQRPTAVGSFSRTT